MARLVHQGLLKDSSIVNYVQQLVAIQVFLLSNNQISLYFVTFSAQNKDHGMRLLEAAAGEPPKGRDDSSKRCFCVKSLFVFPRVIRTCYEKLQAAWSW